ncbi:hypothetical protein RvY_18910 [Ramazzottius varieornatus]|uniref:Uncharacterized protein n=1 Tax=Ramazzottius varieornatus TaxID=947166 RepID=A0A1D1W7R3_RAMVA|nr:hypothetical protein RvY_18910 [Ramazzottius varieornatus]
MSSTVQPFPSTQRTFQISQPALGSRPSRQGHVHHQRLEEGQVVVRFPKSRQAFFMQSSIISLFHESSKYLVNVVHGVNVNKKAFVELRETIIVGWYNFFLLCLAYKNKYFF